VEPFTVHTGVFATLLQPNIDTDAIIPSREMKRVSKRGLSAGLFANWRYQEGSARTPNPQFVLNKPEQHNTSILLAGPNFGCGSSREHAVWALAEFGIKAILAPSFGAIFQKNCTGNGLLAATVDNPSLTEFANWAATNPQQRQLTIDLRQHCVCAAKPDAAAPADAVLNISVADRDRLLAGLDAIAHTLARSAAIDRFEAARFATTPWARLD